MTLAMDQSLYDRLVDEVHVSKLLTAQLRKQLALKTDQDLHPDPPVHDEGIEPPQTAV